MRLRKVLGYGGAGLGAAALTLFVGWWPVDCPGASETTGQRPLPLDEMAFRLTNHEGRTVGPDTLIGRASLVFFGFAFCPEVCPTTLSDSSHWLDGFGEDAD